MATSLLMSNTNKEEINHQPSLRRSNGRRKSKNSCCSSSSSKNEKQKQRGMGVEKLERLIAQERWKEMTEMTINDASVVRDHYHTPNSNITRMMANASAQNVLPMKFGHLGFNPQRSVGGEFNGSIFLGKNVNMAAAFDVHEHCSLCNKKKRVDVENLGAVRSDVSKKMSNFAEAGNFLGLRFGEDDRTYIQENISLRNSQTIPPLRPVVGSYAKQGVEVVAVHKKGSREDGSNTVLTEYEFFPSLKKVTSDHSHQQNGDEDDDDDDMVMMRMTNNVKSSSEASCSCKGRDYQRKCCGADASSSSVDLSLKLSY